MTPSRNRFKPVLASFPDHIFHQLPLPGSETHRGGARRSVLVLPQAQGHQDQRLQQIESPSERVQAHRHVPAKARGQSKTLEIFL